MAGVGSGPQRSTSTPMEQSPEASAVSSMYPESRVSLPMTMRCRWLPRLIRYATARPSWSIISPVIGQTFATPRIPSVPKSLRAGSMGFSLKRNAMMNAPLK